MVLSNAERQARYRARRREDALECISRYEASRAKALAWIARIDGGVRHYEAEGNAPWRDCTDELREEQVRHVEMFTRLIEMYRRDAGTTD